MKEIDELNITLTILRRDVNGLLEVPGARSGTTDYTEQGHIMGDEDGKEVKINEE